MVVLNTTLRSMANVARQSAITRRSLLTLKTQYGNNNRVSYFSTKGLIINAVGADRLGIVSDMTKYVVDVGGNVGESQATKLGKYFSLMMRVDVPIDGDSVDKLTSSLENMEDMNATIFAIDDDDNNNNLVNPDVGYAGRLELEGADNPGIVHKVTDVLARHGLNVDRMDTSDSMAPHGGTTLFQMNAIVQAYEPLAHGFQVDLTKCKEELEDLGDNMNCDIQLLDEN